MVIQRGEDVKIFISLLFIHFFVSCAGPMNPFGSDIKNIVAGVTRETKEMKEKKRTPAQKESKVSIDFYPKFQNRHSLHDIFVVVQTSNEFVNPRNIKFYWNNKDISKTVLSVNDIVYQNENELVLKIKNIRLQAFKDNHIFVYYKSELNNKLYGHEYAEPQCNYNEDWKIKTTRPFNVKKSFINLVENKAIRQDINPAFITAIIAQESGFNYKAVSHAKAIGLTQVTNLASTHVQKKYKRWKSDRRIKKLPTPVIRTLIGLNKITRRHDWRLDKTKSVIGGIEYIKYLKKYWAGNTDLITRVYGEHTDHDAILTDLILASYNSGPYRTKSNLIEKGIHWKEAKELREAKKYLNKVKSFCYHFSDEQGETYEVQAANF